MQELRFRPVAVVLLCLHLVGCTTWQPVQVSPRVFILAESPKSVRVHRQDGEILSLHAPSLTSDSIVGLTNRHIASTRTFVALVDVSQIERRGFSAGKTLLGLSITAAIVMAGVLVAVAANDCFPYECSRDR